MRSVVPQASLCTLALALACIGNSSAQQPVASNAMAATSGVLEPEKLPLPLYMTGIGNGHLQISTSSPEAQIWFDQGLNLLNDFWDYESSRAFEQAIRLDPNCAMCYWGLYHAESFHDEDETWSTDALKHAEKLSKHATPQEKLYIAAGWEEEKARKQKVPSHDDESMTIAHIDSKQTRILRKLIALSPDDTEARILLAESLMDEFDKNSQPNPGTSEGQAILKATLAQHPDDSATNHYWIHAVEPGLAPADALASARKLGALAPASGHMVHMPGHIFYRTGDYESARNSFLTSMRVDVDYMSAQHVAVDNDWNYVHNLMYLIADLLEAGRIQEATAISNKLNAARGMSDATLYRHSTRDGITRLDPELPVALRSADWPRATELLRHSNPAPNLENLIALRASLLDYTQGLQALQAGDAASAEKYSEDMDKLMLSKPSSPEAKMVSMPGMPTSKDAVAAPLHSFLNVAALELQGSILMVRDKIEEADATFNKAMEAEKHLGYHEPPNYIRPVGETRGDALMRAHWYNAAKQAYEAALEERPNSGYPLFGIAQAEAAENKTAAATDAYQRLLTAWAKADPDLPQLTTAHAWLVQHAATSSQGR